MNSMKLNMDIKTRDEMIFGKYDPDSYMGGCRSFGNMSVDLLSKLVEMNFADPDDRQNDAPSIEEFIEFMNKWSGYVVHGYVISDKRSDYRVSVEAIEKIGEFKTKEEFEDFVSMFRYADEFDTKGYTWFD